MAAPAAAGNGVSDNASETGLRKVGRRGPPWRPKMDESAFHGRRWGLDGSVSNICKPMSGFSVDRERTSLPQIGSGPAWNFQCFKESIADATSRGWPDIDRMHTTSPRVSNPTTNTTLPSTLTSFPRPGGNTGMVCRSRAFICRAEKRTSRGGQHTVWPLGSRAIPPGSARTAKPSIIAALPRVTMCLIRAINYLANQRKTGMLVEA
jgi:hypothetical protein